MGGFDPGEFFNLWLQSVIFFQHEFCLGIISDLGVLNEDGYGKIVGRIKDMIIRGGENVYPREIEEILHAHPSVQEAQVNDNALIFYSFMILMNKKFLFFRIALSCSIIN